MSDENTSPVSEVTGSVVVSVTMTIREVRVSRQSSCMIHGQLRA